MFLIHLFSRSDKLNKLTNIKLTVILFITIYYYIIAYLFLKLSYLCIKKIF